MIKFEYDPSPQHSPRWFELRRGKVTASRLADWLAVSKAKGKEGEPLKARLDYERELQFERQFGVNYNNFLTEAMMDGMEYEKFAVDQYQQLTGVATVEVGCWYSDKFVASPDRDTWSHKGLIETKVVRDATFTEILLSGVPTAHWQQIQGQLWATGREWCDYVALNLTTQKVVILRVTPEPDFHQTIAASLAAELSIEPFSTENVFDVVGKVPERETVRLDVDQFHSYQIGGTDRW